jgi:hypothetical protein
MGKLLRKHSYAFGRAGKFRYVYVVPINQNPLDLQDISNMIGNKDVYIDQLPEAPPAHEKINNSELPF